MSTGPGMRRFASTFRHPLLLVLTILLAPALWMLFVSSSNPHEMVVGVFASIATVIFTVFVCHSSSSSLTFRPRDVAQAWRIPWYILSGVWDITQVLFKDLLRLSPAENLYRVCGFDSSKHDPVRIARTVLAVSYTTTAPNFIVVGVDESQSRMLFHQISPSSVPKMTKALGAKS